MKTSNETIKDARMMTASSLWIGLSLFIGLSMIIYFVFPRFYSERISALEIRVNHLQEMVARHEAIVQLDHPELGPAYSGELVIPPDTNEYHEPNKKNEEHP